MELSELRQGNYVATVNGYIKVDFFNDTTRSYLHNCFGLRIDEECLERLGFEEGGDGHLLRYFSPHYLELRESNGYWYPTYAQMPEISHEDEQQINLNGILYVHQLQNLYFALAQKELVIK